MALRQLRKLWKGSGLKMVACVRTDALGASCTRRGHENATSASGGGAQDGTNKRRRRALADYGSVDDVVASQSVPEASPPSRGTLQLIGLDGVVPTHASPSGSTSGSTSSARTATAHSPIRPDIGLTLVATREGDTIFKLGKPVTKKRAVAAVRADVSPKSHRLTATVGRSPLEESQRLHRARQIEHEGNHTSIVRASVQEWKRQQTR